MSGAMKRVKTKSGNDNRTIPWALEKEVMRIMVKEDLPWEAACMHLATLVNNVDLKKLVEDRAATLGKSRFMRALNTSRATIEHEAASRTANAVRRTETNFSVPCFKGCGKPMFFSSWDSNYSTKVEPVLRKAFERWSHVTCPE
jgi:hypothetical protein